MTNRNYNRRVQIYAITQVSDGYGGFTVTESLVGESWAKIKTVANSSRYVGRLTDLGITNPLDAIVVNLWNRNDITINPVTHFLVYNGSKYMIQALTNMDLRNRDLEIIAVRAEYVIT